MTGLALVTGGCRRLGAAIAAHFADHGFALALHASEDPAPERALARQLEADETPWQGFAADLSDADAATALIPRIAAAFGRPPDILINSAAMFGQDRPESVTGEALLDHYAVNCAAPVLLARAFAEALGGKPGAIVNILDQRIANPHGDQFAYGLSKIALAGATQILARELAPAIRVNGVAPGLTIATDDYDAETIDRARAAMPLEKLPRPGQIADAAFWLTQAGAVTGQVLYVDGGAHLRSFERDFANL
ncbi:SDR family oxidoreductase [uncultured Parasphingopyxis sp.]|uniref:SDR family oxidoreductase n=1 Tax=uncultured Parasphingopyxis sp. TaxID=1547918 RepID=UPI002618C0C4|nr:SDR family oxidoreductase [uncultured Parasphingopyxis sp.]